jgi:hypothetical protein
MNEVEQLRAEAQAMRKVLLAALMSAPSEHQRPPCLAVEGGRRSCGLLRRSFVGSLGLG